MPTPDDTPDSLTRLIAEGHATIDPHGHIIGTATDGTKVTLGTTHNRPATLAYLTDHPTPDTW